MIHIIRDRATPEQILEMRQELQTYIKVAVDLRRRVVAGGGEFHADCQTALVEDGSEEVDVWGADWVPETRSVRFEALINIRPKRGNRSMGIEDAQVRATVEAIVRERFA